MLCFCFAKGSIVVIDAHHPSQTPFFVKPFSTGEATFGNLQPFTPQQTRLFSIFIPPLLLSSSSSFSMPFSLPYLFSPSSFLQRVSKKSNFVLVGLFLCNHQTQTTSVIAIRSLLWPIKSSVRTSPSSLGLFYLYFSLSLSPPSLSSLLFSPFSFLFFFLTSFFFLFYQSRIQLCGRFCHL